MTYAATPKKLPSAQPKLVKQFTDVVVSAVYRDLDDKERRASNIVVNGLPDSSDDKSSITQLLIEEFHFTPTVNKCRRLGKDIIPGKIRPLLVGLGSTAEASSIISRAKTLRHSAHSHVRQHVFINADVTKAEALAAYQKRCERRERASKQQQQQQQQQQQRTLTSSTGLAASAQPFIPASGTPGTTSTVQSVLVSVDQQ